MISWWLGSIILIVIFAVVCIVLGIKSGDDGFYGSLFVFLFLGLIVLDFFCGIHSFLNSEVVNKKYVYTNKANVQSIEDNLKTSGQFILGCGGIGSDLYYYVMVGNDKDGYTVDKYNVEDTYLIPEENVQPYYIEKHEKYDIVFKNNFLFGGLFKPINPWLNRDNLEKKEIHLPKNYIKKNYNIDMK